MNKDARDTALLAVGILGAIAICTISVGWGPNSAGRIEARVEQAANAALVKADLGFWHATAHGQSIDLEGIAANEQARQQAIDVVKAVSGVTGVGVEDVSVIPLASPFVWSASKQDGRVSIEGVAPSRAAANAVHQAAIRLFASDMSDGMTLATGRSEERRVGKECRAR